MGCLFWTTISQKITSLLEILFYVLNLCFVNFMVICYLWCVPWKRCHKFHSFQHVLSLYFGNDGILIFLFFNFHANFYFSWNNRRIPFSRIWRWFCTGFFLSWGVLFSSRKNFSFRPYEPTEKVWHLTYPPFFSWVHTLDSFCSIYVNVPVTHMMRTSLLHICCLGLLFHFVWLLP